MIEYTVKVYEDGTKFWYLNGKHHREDGPAVEWADGSKFWYLDDKLHREDGPAIECEDGSKYWYLNGKRHREDGPAIEWANGGKCWCLDGKYLTQEEHRARMSPAKELTMAELSALLGYEVKIVKES
jgi:hypothetical protein